MSVKSIVDVEINDAKFKRFSELFDKYQNQLARTPNVWKGVSKETAALAGGFERMSASLLAQTQLNREGAEDEKKRLANTTLSERLWTSMGKSSGTFAKNLLGATESLLKWTGLLSAVGGLLGAGGLFGIDRMAASVGSERRGAQGVGLSIGQQKAFGINFGRLVDPDSYLGWINGMEGDITKQQAAFGLMGHGLSGDTSKDAVSMLDAVRSLAKRTPLQQLAPILSAYGVNLSPEEQRRLKFGSDKEYNDIKSQYGADSKSLNIDDGTAKAWQDFTKQMQEAGGEIFKTFVVGLKPLAGPLTDLSKSFTHFVEVLLKSDLVGEGINKLAKWMNEFSGEISTPKFLESVKSFVSDVGDMAQAIHGVVHWQDSAKAETHKFQELFEHDDPMKEAGRSNYAKILGVLDKKYGLPAGMLEAQWQTESSSNLTPAASSKGALGPFQFMPATAKALGINPLNPMQSADGAGRLDAENMARYHGNVAQALAAYNSRPSTIDGAISARGSNWLSGAPGETQKYVKDNQVIISIYNNTGGSVHTSMSQLAH